MMHFYIAINGIAKSGVSHLVRIVDQVRGVV
jgi:hypothetical protein